MNLGALAEAAAGALIRGNEPEAAHAIMTEAIDRLNRREHPFPPGLLHQAIDTAVHVGDGAAADALLERSETGREADDPFEAGSLLLRTGRRRWARGDAVKALADFDTAAKLFASGDHERDLAIARGATADILQAQGELDEALRIRREEQFPVYERLGDVRSRAVTMGRIADVLQAQGELEEALRIRREEQFPVYERLGDVRSRAVTMGKVADVLQAQGELEEALRIRREEQLPVYERLGDVRERPVTMGKIADILQSRGELEEALRIRREEQLPVFERLGDVRGRAVTLQKIAVALLEGGELGQGDIQEIYEALAEAYAIAVSLKIPDGIGATGVLLGQVLAMGGQRDKAIEVLEAAQAAFKMLRREEDMQNVAAIRNRLEAT